MRYRVQKVKVIVSAACIGQGCAQRGEAFYSNRRKTRAPDNELYTTSKNGSTSYSREHGNGALPQADFLNSLL